MAPKDLIFIPGSKTFDIPFGMINKRLSKGQGIQSGRFTLGGYDWVIEFYPKERSESRSDNSVFYIKVVNATEEVLAFFAMHHWDWTTSKWDGCCETMMVSLQPSGFDFSYEKMTDLASSKYLKDDTIRMKWDILVTPRPPAPEPPLNPDVDKVSKTCPPLAPADIINCNLEAASKVSKTYAYPFLYIIIVIIFSLFSFAIYVCS